LSMLFVVVALVLAAVVCDSTSVPYKSCGGSITVGTVDITPFPIKKGQTATLSMSGVAGADVADGQYTIVASAYGVPVKTITGAFSEVTTVPFKNGDNVKVSYGLVIPAYAPDITVDIEFSGTDSANNTVFCMDFSSQVTLALS